MAKNDLTVVGVRLVGRVKRVRDDCVVFFSGRYLLFVGVAWPGRDNDILVAATPADVYDIKTGVFVFRAHDTEGVLRRDFTHQETLLAGDHELTCDLGEGHLVDVASLLDLEGVRHSSFVLRKGDHVDVTKGLAYDEDILACINQGSDVRLLHCNLADLFKLFRLVEHDNSTITGETQPFSGSLGRNFVN